MTTAPRTIRMTIEYDGTAYAGWQLQRGSPTIQGQLEAALEKHLGHPVRVTASGRTDSGVHARGQVISFHTDHTMPAVAMGRAINTSLPSDIVVRESAEALPTFDARRSARLRWYRFYLHTRSVRPALGARYLTLIAGRLDIRKFRLAAEALSGEHDFQAFRSAACTAKRTRLTLHPIQVTELPDGILQLDIRCRSFLHNMVRILTGTMVAVAQGRMTLDDVQQMLLTGERHGQSRTVGPQGLFLWEVSYEPDHTDA